MQTFTTSVGFALVIKHTHIIIMIISSWLFASMFYNYVIHGIEAMTILVYTSKGSLN